MIIGVVSSKHTTNPSRPCDSYYPGIYARVDSTDILTFIKFKAFGANNINAFRPKTTTTKKPFLGPLLPTVAVKNLGTYLLYAIAG